MQTLPTIRLRSQPADAPERIAARCPRRPQPVTSILRRFRVARSRPAISIERLEKAALSLRPMERAVLVLSARDRLSNREIAVRLAITAEAAERLLASAICSLDRALERQERRWWWFW
jgi:DNA-directed RNA polymerase specialized sigma24 family protein